jgi:hypothetical protein
LRDAAEKCQGEKQHATADIRATYLASHSGV